MEKLVGSLTWKEHAIIFLHCIDRALDASRPLDLNGKQILVPDWDTRLQAAAIICQFCPPDESTRRMLLRKARETEATARKELGLCPAD